MKSGKIVSLLGYLIRIFTICYVASSFAWLLWLGVNSPSYYRTARPQDHINAFVLNIPGISLIPFAVFVIMNPIFRIRLGPAEILISSWFMSAAEILVFFSFAAANSEGRVSYPRIESVILSFLAPGIFAIVYTLLRK